MVASLPTVPPVPIHPHLSTVIPRAPPLSVCPLLELPSFGSVPFLTVPFVCAPLSGTAPPPPPVLGFYLLRVQPQISDLTPFLSLPIQAHLSSLFLGLPHCSGLLPNPAPSPLGHGPQTQRPWEISIPGCPQTLKPNATPLPVPNTPRHQAQVWSSRSWISNLPRDP